MYCAKLEKMEYRLERSHSSLSSSSSWATAEEELPLPVEKRRYHKERALLYIDNSNVFISAQKHSAFLRGFRERIYDSTCRIDMKKLYKLALTGREKIGKGKLFGSPSALSHVQLETVWEAYQKDIEVILSRRNVMAKEKCVDTELVASAVEELINYSAQFNRNSVESEESEEDAWGWTPPPTVWTNVFILFSGDADMKPLVNMAVKYGWKVEIWCFKINLADCLKRMADDVNVTLKFIDGPAPAIAPIPVLTPTLAPSSMTTCTCNGDNQNQNGGAKIFDKIVFYETEWKQRDDENRLDRSILLTFKSTYFLTGYEEMKRRKVLLSKMTQISSKLFRLPTQGYVINPDFPAHFVLVCGPPEHPNKNKPPLYNFNEDVWSKRHKLLAALKEDGCEKIETYQLYHQQEEKRKEEINLYSNGNGCTNGNGSGNSNGHNHGENLHESPLSKLPDDDPGDTHYPLTAFTVVDKKKKKFGIQNSSGKKCPHEFTCTNYPNCAHIHSEQEKKYFRVHRDVAKLDRRTYKTVKCAMEPCKFQTESWLCRFAHCEKEARCRNCKRLGHFLSNCTTPSKFK